VDIGQYLKTFLVATAGGRLIVVVYTCNRSLPGDRDGRITVQDQLGQKYKIPIWKKKKPTNLAP
jgi:hypothetical protein